MSPQKIGIYRKTPDFSACIGERRPQLPSWQSWAVKMVAIATAWQCVALNQQLEDAGSAAIICPMPSAWKLWYMFCSVCQLSKFTNAAAHMSDFVVQTGATGEASSTAAESARGRVPQMSSEVLALSRSIPTVNRESLCSKSSTFLQSFWIITLSALSPSRSAFVLGGKLAGAIGNTSELEDVSLAVSTYLLEGLRCHFWGTTECTTVSKCRVLQLKSARIWARLKRVALSWFDWRLPSSNWCSQKSRPRLARVSLSLSLVCAESWFICIQKMARMHVQSKIKVTNKPSIWCLLSYWS